MAFNKELGFDPDEKWANFSRDARAMFVQEALEEKRQQQTDAQAAVQAARAAADASDQWVDFIDRRIKKALEEAAGIIGCEVGKVEKSLRQEIQQTLRKRLEIVRFDPSEVMRASMKAELAMVTEPLLAAVSEVRKELKGLRRKSGEVVDLPQLPKREAS